VEICAKLWLLFENTAHKHVMVFKNKNK